MIVFAGSLRLWCAVALSGFLPFTGISTSHALEGGDTSKEKKWKHVSIERPDDATRQRELSARKAAIAADIKRLTARLTREPNPSKIAALQKELATVNAAYG